MKKTFVLLSSLMLFLSAAAAEAPRYIFYFIGDGMGMGHVMTTQAYNRLISGNDSPILMMSFPVASAAYTYSASSPVTDSAAAGTALSSGVKTRNGMLGMNPDTIAVPTLAEQLKALGYGVGVATTVAPDDATPAAFYAHVPNRGMYREIGAQAVKSGVDFLAGAWLRGLVDKKGNETGLRKEIKDAGIEFAVGAEGFAKATAPRVFMLNNDSARNWSVGFTIDSLPAPRIDINDITRAGIKHLQRVSPDKFFLMVEGGNIDHAGHANDAATVVKETLKFQEAIQIAYDFYLEHPDETLIVITADHDTGGMTLGNGTVGYDAHLQYFDLQKMSKDVFADYWKDEVKRGHIPSWEEMEAFLRDKFGFWEGLTLSEKETENLRRAFDESFTNPDGKDIKTLYNTYNRFVVDLFKTYDAHTGIGWTSGGHTGNLVPVYAIGKGSELFIPISNNIEIPEKILRAVGSF